MAFERYAEYYDILYRDKDYESECDFIEEIFAKYSATEVKTVLDVGCGTGGHAIPLAKRGYKVVGIDKSEIMIKKAREKSKNVEFYVNDITNFKFNKKFDACIAMFAVISYVTSTKDVLKAFKNIREHLKEDSLFISDVWNGLAVLRLLPERRVKIVESNKLKIIRIAEPELDTFNHLCKVHYRIIALEDGKLVDEIKEMHVVRYYFPQEIKHYLEDAGFEVVKICPFMDLNGKVDDAGWNMCIVARKR